VIDSLQEYVKIKDEKKAKEDFICNHYTTDSQLVKNEDGN